MLTLGLPPRRDPRALFDELLSVRCPDPTTARALTPSPFFGAAVVPASTIGAEDRDLIGRLDIDPGGIGAARFTIGVPEDQLSDALSLRPPAPLTIFCAGGDMAAVAAAIVAAGHSPGLDAGDTENRTADLLAVVAHSDTGFFAHVHRPDQILGVVAATVAALRGDDIRDAIRRPNIDALTSMHPEAAAATREVLLGIEVDDAAGALSLLGSIVNNT
jgi:hypothetical protein